MAVLSGMVTGFVAISLVEALGHLVYPPSPGVVTNDPQVMSELMQTMPVGALLFIALAHFCAGIFGNVVVLMVSRRKKIPAVIYSMLLLAGTVSLFMMLPHPAWFIAVDLAGVILAVFIVLKLVKSPSKK